MIIAQANELGPEWLQIRAVPEEGDACPLVDSLIVRLDSAATFSPDRIAVAGAIAFHPWVSSMLHFEREISPLTAQRLAQVLAPRWLSISPVMCRAYPLPRGDADIVVSSKAIRDEWTLNFSPIGYQQRSVVTSAGLTIPSNAPILEEMYPEPNLSLGAAFLAAAVLVAEPAGAARLFFDETAVSPRLVRRFGSVVEATGLTIATREPQE